MSQMPFSQLLAWWASSQSGFCTDAITSSRSLSLTTQLRQWERPTITVILYLLLCYIFSQYLTVSEIIIFTFFPVYLGGSSEMQYLRAWEVV